MGEPVHSIIMLFFICKVQNWFLSYIHILSVGLL